MIKNCLYILILTTIIIFTVFGKNGLVELSGFQKQLSDLSTKLQELRNESNNESNSLFGIKHSPAYLEKISREDLGLSKPNEVIYVFEENEKKK